MQERSGKLYMEIAEEIRRQIEEGVFRPGDRLPTLRELADRFGVSRATVREALGALRGQGLVEFRHGMGTYVRTASVEMWMQPLDAAILLSYDNVSDLVELQTAVLAQIAYRAAANRMASDYSALSHALFEIEASPRRSEHRIASELKFFSVLAEVAGNRLLENALRVLQEALRSSLRLLSPKSDLGVKACRAIYNAVQTGRPAEARDAVYAYGEAILRTLAEKKGNHRSTSM
ncbi:FadR/GntR family transcriptional regulator [Alicyclobacillus vulcanalis]|uniref:Transcriptional regulator, GntR family n=1 Tax=Alicyclobacillus vulcanalis TaxID=252246 RepID=A0A1N7NWL4_9BACL|nr:GntR family transcriptional regulator [Alicyclobacillus vulcanalis]SIT02710.1 transcriptional regulator, GntR family [Alicyclobacillus vulcanalis]